VQFPFVYGVCGGFVRVQFVRARWRSWAFISVEGCEGLVRLILGVFEGVLRL
jgi:hypothetical protein